MKADFPTPHEDTDSPDDDNKFDSAVNRSSRVAIRKFQRNKKDEEDDLFVRPHGGFSESVIVQAEENFFDFSESPE